MKVVLCVVLIITLNLSFSLTEYSKKRRIILDADVGTDDAFALFVLLDAERRELIKVEAIVCSNGNADTYSTCRNLVRVLEILHRTDIPVYRGAKDSIIETNEKLDEFSGKDGFGDLNLKDEPNMSIIQPEPAAVAIHNIIKRYPSEISLLCIAPLTNPALSIKIYEDLIPNLRDIFIMGGNYLGVGNIRSMAEFNFFIDPEAAFIILNEINRPIKLLPYETCLNADVSLDWRFNVLGRYRSSFMDLLNRVEIKTSVGKLPNSTWESCDTFLTLTMIDPDLVIQEKRMNLTIELHGGLTRGEVVVNRSKKENDKSNLVLIEEVNYEKVKHHLIEIARELSNNIPFFSSSSNYPPV